MNTTVIICSVDRPAILHDTVLGLMKQTVPADAVVLSLCDDNSVWRETKELPGVRCVFGQRGSSAQRNTTIPLARTPYALFLDDDVELAADYIGQMERASAEDPTIVVASGGVAGDGAPNGKGITREAARQAIRNYSGSRSCSAVKDLYGCNIFVRSDVLRTEKFDERLPLYGWMEDHDFRWRCEKHGKVVCHQGAVLAHLGIPSMSVSDVRYGYAKIANPWYLWRKGVLASLPELIVNYWLKTTTANLLRILAPGRPQTINYWQRLMGNCMAYRDFILGRIDPLNILKIPDTTEPPGKLRRLAQNEAK